jgi:alpha-amylase
MKALIALVIVVAAVAAPSAAADDRDAQHSLRAPVTGERFYFVMADRFENGRTDNDLGGLPPDRLVSGFDRTHKGFYHGGDLKGLRDQLDYIEDLGTTAIWLTPSFKNKAVQLEDGPSAGYHGYWITDFTQIDPHLGSNEELKALVDDAHRRGMKVFFDIITNHTADVIDYREATRPAYVSKDEVPYRDAFGNPFDDREYAGSDRFPPLDAETSFPFTPYVPDGQPPKVPGWLNDVTLYHNRGNTTFVGENSYYGDFFGLDDLFTEHTRVVEGMKEIYEEWIAGFGIDGFRIDTMKHVDDAFWKEFAPDVLDFARRQGKREFFMFGEVFDTTKPFTSHFTTHDRVQAVLDFPFQAAAQGFAAGSSPTHALRDFFVGDDWYTDADSNVYQLPTFLGNHDMGRIGMFVRNANPGAADAELLARDRLAHELMFLSRGNPVIYYGDEQGFTGIGGDQSARQDMFASQVAEYNENDLIGTDATTAERNFDRGHPLYRSIARLAHLTERHDALRDGAHQHRSSSSGAGVYAFSRLDRREQREYVVALNNAEQSRTAAIPTYVRRGEFDRVYGEGPRSLRTDGSRRLTVTVPALSAVVYELDGRIPRSHRAPSLRLTAPGEGRDRVEVGAEVDGDSFYEVTFRARTGRHWHAIGTDDTAPYRVFHDVADLEPGTRVEYEAIVLDNRGHTRTSRSRTTRVAQPSIAITTPAEGANVRGSADVTAEVVPEHPDDVVVFERQIGDGAWTQVGTDSSSPVYTLHDTFSLELETGTPIRYRATLDGIVVSAVRTVRTQREQISTAVVHYRRADGNYADWGLHLWGRRARRRRGHRLARAAPADADRERCGGLRDPARGRHRAGRLHRPQAGRRQRADHARARRRPLLRPARPPADLAAGQRPGDLLQPAASVTAAGCFAGQPCASDTRAATAISVSASPGSRWRPNASRTSSRWVGSQRSTASRPLSVITAKVARRSVGGVRRSTRPASSIRAISRVAPPRERNSASASSFIRTSQLRSLISTSNHAAGMPVVRSHSDAR